jgi:hypothetical protein
MMTCQEVAFAQATCRIDIDERTDTLGRPRYAASISLVDEATHSVRPLIFLDRHRAEVHASSEGLALNSAIAFLERRFGGLSEPPPRCVHAARRLPTGDPVTLPE